MVNEPINFIDPKGLYWGLVKAYAQVQYQALQSLIGGYGAAAVAGGAAAVTVVAAPVVASSPLWTNPNVQNSAIDFTMSLFPGAPSPNISVLLGTVVAYPTSPHEVAR